MNAMFAANKPTITNNAVNGVCNRKKIGDHAKFNTRAMVQTVVGPTGGPRTNVRHPATAIIT